MYHFCTLFDSNYLSRGLALYRSLERVCESFHLYIFAFDDRSARILRTLSLPHATVIPLSEFEDSELLRVKPTRSRAEYCWTATSSAILYVLDRFKVDMCTYLDADMLFFSSPAPLFEEFRNNSILLTEHRYTRRYDKSSLSGIYCVQFVTFRNDDRGRTALQWWRDRCLEWCYARHEDGKFGDQKYLDDWTTRFPGVHVLQHLGGGMAAWNIQQYDVFMERGVLRGHDIASGMVFDVIFYHFHYLRFLNGDRIELGRRILRSDALRLLYRPYLTWLGKAREEAMSVEQGFDPHGTSPAALNWKTPILFLYRKLNGIYNIFPVNDLLED